MVYLKKFKGIPQKDLLHRVSMKVRGQGLGFGDSLGEVPQIPCG